MRRSVRRLPRTPDESPRWRTHREDGTLNAACSPNMRQPLRSQSFKHQPRQAVDVKKTFAEDTSSERRRSTPTVSRRSSLVNRRQQEQRTDVWPEPKPATELDEKFLKLPTPDEYQRVRQFNIDERGVLVSRGDSFRRKIRESAVKSDKSSPPYFNSARSDSTRCVRSESASSTDEHGQEYPTAADPLPSTSHKVYKICVVGDTSTGKSSLISQLITSEYKNAFAGEIQDQENSVSICIGGEELDLMFVESDMSDDEWVTNEVDAFIVVYSIDSRRSWKKASTAIEMIRGTDQRSASPIVVAGNKADLERKRTVTKSEVRTVSAYFGLEVLEISVALDHDVDDLLVSLVAELKDAYMLDKVVEKPSPRIDDFNAAIRRYSQRKKKTLPEDVDAVKCSRLSPSCLINKFKSWRKGNAAQ